MRRALLVCALVASAFVSYAAPGSAAPAVTVTLNEPRMTAPTTAELSGTVSGRDQVSLEVKDGARWRTAQTVPADSVGNFRAVVTATDTPTYYRARAAKSISGQVLVQALPEPEPEPDPIDECGPRPVKADGSLWSCTVSEEFAGTELNRSLWMPQTIFTSGTEEAWACYLDDPSVISVHDDALHLTVRKLEEPIACPGNNDLEASYVSGMVSTYRLFSQQYGRFEARIKSTATSSPGLQETFWLWPDDRYSTELWPAAGEIDISETYSQYPDLSIPFLHYTPNDNGGPVPGLNTAWDCIAHRGEWNTYALEWSATRLEIFVNGRSCLVNTSGDRAFQKPYIAAFTQLLGVGDNAVTAATPLPATMSIDYLRIWQ